MQKPSAFFLFIFITRPLNKFLAIVAVKWEKNKCRVVVYRMKYGKEWGRIECWTKAKLLPCGRKTVQRLEHWRYIDGLSNKKKEENEQSMCGGGHLMYQAVIYTNVHWGQQFIKRQIIPLQCKYIYNKFSCPPRVFCVPWSGVFKKRRKVLWRPRRTHIQRFRAIRH